MAIIVLASLPVVATLGVIAFLWLSTHRARASAEEARRAVRVGGTLSEAILTSSQSVGEERFLSCYEALCIEPVERLLARRTNGDFGALDDAGGLHPAESVEQWRRHLALVDRLRCARAKVTFCGRPWMTFLLELDESQRVTGVGSLTVSSD